MPLPSNTGDKSYTRGLSRSLALAGADVTFMALVSEEKDPDAYRRVCPGILWMPIDDAPRPAFQSALSTMPLVAARYATSGFKAALRAELARVHYNCVIFDHYALGWAFEECHNGPSEPSCLVYISHDYEIEVTAAIARNFRGSLLKKVFLYANAWKTARIERRLTRNVDILTVNTEEDRAHYVKLGPKRTPITLRPGFAGYRRPGREIDAAVPRRVVILGSFQWIAKQMNLEQFLQAADGAFAHAGIELQIAGVVDKKLQARWHDRLQATKFLGFVDNLQTFFDQARMGLVIEATGGGFKHKTLDYVFGRLPVAALAPALGGVDDDIRAHFIIEHQLASLVEAICGAIDDFDRLNAMQRGSFLAVQDRFEWEAIGRKLLAGIEVALQSRERYSLKV